jgi:hypothetical protein
MRGEWSSKSGIKKAMKRIEQQRQMLNNKPEAVPKKKNGSNNGNSFHNDEGVWHLTTFADITPYISVLEKVSDGDVEIFMDSNVLFGFDEPNNFFTKLKLVTERVVYPEYKQPIIQTMSHYSELVDFYQSFLSRPNVHIISNVAEESRRGISSLERRLKPKVHTCIDKDDIRAHYIAHFRAILRNNLRFRNSGAEQDPIEERVYAILPEVIETPFRIKNPSKTDRRLVTIPFARSALDGQRKIVVSNDGGVPVVVEKLQEILQQEPESLDLSDFPTSTFQESTVQIYRLFNYGQSGKLDYRQQIRHKFN